MLPMLNPTKDVKVICEAPQDALNTPVIYPVAELKNTTKIQMLQVHS